MLVLNAAEQPWVRPPDQLKKKIRKTVRIFLERERVQFIKESKFVEIILSAL
jgi:hypothetical protein